mmetsp:Transcript_10422/g.22964  ORF Transcript_10422/g.22964 Transcript_10422/m.22964 type:complete len:658 (+) Transcript_10422:1-1974(+)
MKANSRFEHSGLGNLLRIPGLGTQFGDDRNQSTAHGRKAADAAAAAAASSSSSSGPSHRPAGWFDWSGQDKKGKGLDKDPLHGPNTPFLAGGARGRPDDEVEKLEPKTDKLWYLARFSHFMQLWQPYDTHSKYLIGLGLISLSMGGIYYCLGRLTVRGMIVSDFIAGVMSVIFLVIPLLIFQQNFHAKSRLSFFVVVFLFGVGPLLACLACLSRSPAWLQLFAPLCMGSHCLFYFAGWCITLAEFKKPWDVTKKFTTGPQGQEFPEDWTRTPEEEAYTSGISSQSDSDGSYSSSYSYSNSSSARRRGGRAQRAGGMNGDGCVVGRGMDDGMHQSLGPGPRLEASADLEDIFEKGGIERPSFMEKKKILDTNNAVQRATRSAMFFAGLVWLAATIVITAELLPDFSLALRKLDGIAFEDVEVLDINWPVPGTQVDSLTCANGKVFATNGYQILDINITSGSVQAIDCGELDEVVLGVSLACGLASCAILALLEDSSLVDCTTRQSYKLLKDMKADDIAARASNSSNNFEGGLVGTLNKTSVDYRFVSSSSAWTPLWTLDVVPKDQELVAMDFLGSNLGVFGRSTKKSFVWEPYLLLKLLDSGYKTLNNWYLSYTKETDGPVSAACGTEDGTILLAQSATADSDVQLIRAKAPSFPGSS